MIRDPAKTFPDPTQRGSMSDTLTHFDAQGQAHMVDVSAKSETRRVARAEGRIVMQPATLARILAGDKVSLELSPYDLSKGRINFRHIEGRTPPAAHAPRRR